jgi:hypothetical protein
MKDKKDTSNLTSEIFLRDCSSVGFEPKRASRLEASAGPDVRILPAAVVSVIAGLLPSSACCAEENPRWSNRTGAAAR